MKTLANEVGVELDIRPPIGTGSLLLFPIFTGGAPAPDYVCGAGADDSEVVAFHELDDGAEVAELVVENGGELPLLLIEGEMLLGLKQNRTLNTSVVRRAPPPRSPCRVSRPDAGAHPVR
ncbi:MAG TPA: DUF6569 family protein [Aeromicrobium sp.]|nr:DUF6569 family protein [Aeromicrobium sp.]